MQPYRGPAQTDRRARRIQRKKDRKTSPARLASLQRREGRRQFRRYLVAVMVATLTFCLLKDVVLYFLHK